MGAEINSLDKVDESLGHKFSRWEEVYLNLTCWEALGAGSAGPGKTAVLIRDPLAQVYAEHQRCENRQHPYYHAWGESVGWALHLRRTVKMLEQTIGRTHRLYPKIDPGARFDSQKTTWTFSSGYKIQFGHCKDPNSYMDYYSSEFTRLNFDELIQFEKEQYDQIKSRVRTSDPVLSRMLGVRSMSNPMVNRGEYDFTVKNPNWVKDYFVKPHPEGGKYLAKRITLESGEVVIKKRIYLRATLWDNPDKAFVRQYEENLQSQPMHIRQALLYGNWNSTADSYYGESWNPTLHVCRPFRIPDDWPRFRSMDWGFKKPGCVHWYAMDPDGNLFVYRELTFVKKLEVQVAKLILEMELGMGLVQAKRSLLTGPADTQLWEEKGESAKTKAQAMAEAGVYWVRADKKSRQHNAERITARLLDHERGKATPGLVIFDVCRRLIQTITTIPFNPDDPEVPLDGGEDHWVDSLSYGCAYASRGRAGIGQAVRKKEKWEIEDEDDPVVKREDRGQSGYGS